MVCVRCACVLCRCVSVYEQMLQLYPNERLKKRIHATAASISRIPLECPGIDETGWRDREPDEGASMEQACVSTPLTGPSMSHSCVRRDK